jgi:hypothetical protein
MRRGLRAGLGFLAAIQILVGTWALFFPARFFALVENRFRSGPMMARPAAAGSPGASVDYER